MSALPPARLEEVATTSDARPSLPRSGASAVYVHDQLLMLAGYDEDKATAPPPKRSAVNDVFSFSPGELRWRALPVAAASADAGLPAPRLAAGAVELGGHAYLIGGWAAGAPQGAEAFLSDVWRLVPPGQNQADEAAGAAAAYNHPWLWQRLELAPGSLDALGGGGVSRFACATVSPTRALLHTHRCDDHVIALDVGAAAVAAPPSSSSSSPAPAPTARLSRVPVLPDPEHGAPPSRGLHSMTLVGGGGGTGGGTGAASRLLVFGGAPQKGGMLGDLWALDGDLAAAGEGRPLRWTRLWAGPRAAGAEEGGGGQAAGPHVRCSHVAAEVGGGLLVLGGSYYTEQGSLSPLDDAWWFGAAEGGGGKGGQWQRVELGPNPPAARNAAIMARLPPAGGGGGGERRRLLYHGGWRPFVETYDDTWIISF